MYKNDFKDAILRSKKFGLSIQNNVHIDENTTYLTDRRIKELPHTIRDTFGELTPDMLIVQCFAIHGYLQETIEEWLGCPTYFTLGWIETDQNEFFRFDDAFIEDKLNNGHHGLTLNAHAWLTLPSMEVIDLSLMSTIAKAWDEKEAMGGIVLSHADTLNGMRYKPMLVGDDFLRKLGLVLDFQAIRLS